MSSEPVDCSLVFVGDKQVGKLIFLKSYRDSNSSNQQISGTVGTFCKNILIDKQMVTLKLYNSCSQDEYQHLRALVYCVGEVFLILFSINKPQTFINAREKWYREIIKYTDNQSVIFVGINIDNQKENPKANINQKEVPITRQAARKVIEGELKCKYMEWLDNIFHEAGTMALQNKLLATLLTKKKSSEEEVKAANEAASATATKLIENISYAQEEQHCCQSKCNIM